MSNRIKNIGILTILFIFLLIVELIPVNCLIKQFTGISCPACGLTRAFHSILEFKFLDAIYYNILSLPLFFFIITFILGLIIEICNGHFKFIPKVLQLFSNKLFIIITFTMIFISFIINNVFPK